MAAGFAYMNCLTVIQTSQGLAKYLRDNYPGDYAVVIGRDARKNSEKFARLAANAFIAQGFKVLFFAKECTTPMVSWATKARSAIAGVMITASHVSLSIVILYTDQIV